MARTKLRRKNPLLYVPLARFRSAIQSAFDAGVWAQKHAEKPSGIRKWRAQLVSEELADERMIRKDMRRVFPEGYPQ